MKHGSRWIVALLAAVLACAGLCACPKEPAPRVRPGRGDTSRDTQLRTDDLARELELVILDNYLQLSVGNIETYADGIARDRTIMLLGIGPEQVFFGPNPGPDVVDRRPFRERPRCIPGARAPEECAEVVSKRLDIHLYLDDSVGWLSDELSYRIPYGGRQAAVPVRISAVFVRDIDLWVMVAEHLSYALSFEEIIALARDGKLSRPKQFPTRFPPTSRNEMRLFTGSTQDWLNRRPDQGRSARNKLDHWRERARLSEDEKQAAIDRDKLLGDGLFRAITPDPRVEVQEERVAQAESLAHFFGPGATVTIDDYQIDLADNGRVGWMTANLSVLVPGRAGPEVRIGLRGLFLYALDVNGWNLVHSHISVPVTDDQLAQRVFGSLPEPDPPRMQSTGDDAAESPPAPDDTRQPAQKSGNL